MSEPVRADLNCARKMLFERIDYFKKIGDPFGVSYAQAALWSVEKALEEKKHEQQRRRKQI